MFLGLVVPGDFTFGVRMALRFVVGCQMQEYPFAATLKRRDRQISSPDNQLTSTRLAFALPRTDARHCTHRA